MARARKAGLMEILESWPLLLPVASVFLGLVVGSFLNVVVYRLPIMMEREWRKQLDDLKDLESTDDPHAEQASFNLSWPPSACPECGARIKPWQNVPVLSYLLLKGRCAACGTSISKRYPIVESFVALISFVIAWIYGPTWTCVAALAFAWTLIALSLIDIDHHLLPDSMTLPLLWGGLLWNALGGAVAFTDLLSSVLGAAAGYLSLWSVFHVFKLVTGKEGMGYGDFKLLAAVGAWLGWQSLPLVILLSAAVGSIVGISMIVLSGRSRHTPIPFGPYLAAAGWIAMIWGNDITSWYLSLISVDA